MSYGLAQFLFRQNLRARSRLVNWALLAAEQANGCWMPRPNFYTEHDIGTKNVRYPDGTIRRVKTRKVRDTAGITFYTFAEETQLQ